MKVLRYCLLLFSFTIALSLANPPEASAQCPMCRMSASSNLENGGQEGKGLNAGILYMLATPYLLVGGLGYLWWRHRRRQREEEEEQVV